MVLGGLEGHAWAEGIAFLIFICNSLHAQAKNHFLARSYEKMHKRWKGNAFVLLFPFSFRLCLSFRDLAHLDIPSKT